MKKNVSLRMIIIPLLVTVQINASHWSFSSKSDEKQKPAPVSKPVNTKPVDHVSPEEPKKEPVSVATPSEYVSAKVMPVDKVKKSALEKSTTTVKKKIVKKQKPHHGWHKHSKHSKHSSRSSHGYYSSKHNK